MTRVSHPISVRIVTYPGDWTICQYSDNGHLHDNPALGVSDDKVAIGTDVFTWPQASASDPPLGADTIVVDKAAMLSSGNCPVGVYAPTNAGIIRPAQSLTATSTNPEAPALAAYLRGPAARARFEAQGFTVLDPAR